MFVDHFVSSLPGEAGPPRTPRPVFGAAWSAASPTPVQAPHLIAWSDEVAALLGWSRPEADRGGLVDVLAGNRIAPGSRPFAACYGGHQFGTWAGQLGDGRAISLGEVVHDGTISEVQLKGAGPTPYSRRADGRAVLRSSIREFLCSEAMHHLGVPTTRALALVGTGDGVVRDMFYDGHPRLEPGAIVTRVAPTFVRFGNFELFARRDDPTLLTALLDWVIRTHYPALAASGDPTSQSTRGAFFGEVCRRTGVMIAHWMAHGFVHGVMNTDNFSILGLTIDYGPYGWLDSFDPWFTPNTTDLPGRRYAYARQPSVALWNLARLADALLGLIGHDHATAGLERYERAVQDTYGALMGRKLGFIVDDDARTSDLVPTPIAPGDDALHAALLAWLAVVETDWTIFFRRLTDVDVADGVSDERLIAPLTEAFYAPGGLAPEARARVVAWLRDYAARVRMGGADQASRTASMRAHNPWFILRNYLAQAAIDRAEAGDFAGVTALLDAARRPFEVDPTRPELFATFFARRPEWARDRAGCSALSCSS